ncbi:hypothetical protein GCM10009129_00110 [Psychrobacter aestuarii]|uniref:Uncharacterized protein n=1 Tax=Psychrobacter aestuarii TaxID=556327 RepID=A0ABP3F666_9GAMM
MTSANPNHKGTYYHKQDTGAAQWARQTEHARRQQKPLANLMIYGDDAQAK